MRVYLEKNLFSGHNAKCTRIYRRLIICREGGRCLLVVQYDQKRRDLSIEAGFARGKIMEIRHSSANLIVCAIVFGCPETGKVGG